MHKFNIPSAIGPYCLKISFKLANISGRYDGNNWSFCYSWCISTTITQLSVHCESKQKHCHMPRRGLTYVYSLHVASSLAQHLAYL